jgi:hypothetical protein
MTKKTTGERTSNSQCFRQGKMEDLGISAALYFGHPLII